MINLMENYQNYIFPLNVMNAKHILNTQNVNENSVFKEKT